jgi:hypothetical protein
MSEPLEIYPILTSILGQDSCNHMELLCVLWEKLYTTAKSTQTCSHINSLHYKFSAYVACHLKDPPNSNNKL